MKKFAWQIITLFLFVLVRTGTSFAAEVPSFESDIQQILKSKCLECHGEKDPHNNLNLTTRAGLIQGGKTGSAMTPGSLRDSLIWSFLATDKMPDTKEKLTATEKDLIRRWILAGAPETASEAKQIEQKKQASSKLDLSQALGVTKTSQLIDKEIRLKLSAEKIIPSDQADDAEFLRRVYLDLNGRVPNFAETVKFLKDQDPDKRKKLIDQRLDSDEFGRHMSIVWHKLLVPKSAGAYDRIPHRKFKVWLADQFNHDSKWSQIVTELITAEGYLPSNKDTENNIKKDKKLQPQNVATSFINAHNTEGRPQPKGIIASVSKLFLAQSIDCAQCHNHPLAKWEQTDFWAAAAFFERVRYERAVYGDTSIGRLSEPTEGKDLIYDDKAKARHSFVPAVYSAPVIDLQDPNGNRTGQMVRATFLDGTIPELDPQKSYRAVFAEWITSTKNPFFSKAIVNRAWAQLLGRGFVEPVDDMSEDNRPSHPEILELLAAEFTASGHDLKHLYRCICNSETYGRSSQPSKNNTEDSTLFSKQALKQMTEDQLILSLETILPTFAERLVEDAEDKNPGLYRKAFLEIQETGLGPATEHTRGLQQALSMMNGEGKHFNLEALKGKVSKSNSPEENISNIYLQALNRYPSETELSQMRLFIEVAQDEIKQLDPRRVPQRKKGHPDNTPDPYADVLWVLINSGEFIFNH